MNIMFFIYLQTSHLLAILIKTVIPTRSTRALELLVLMKCLWVQLGAQRPMTFGKEMVLYGLVSCRYKKTSILSYLAISA